jgi:hypothetical protein
MIVSPSRPESYARHLCWREHAVFDLTRQGRILPVAPPAAHGWSSIYEASVFLPPA